ncbi:hypothetical protein SAMN04487968_11289 [Nocardioides terrae]|uniref:Uncharacterized protein n=1 Tax=Nocardioides terrae TaxID=574651 RepID=A0A1I1MSB2_9ACTN|nr:hypothetical protein [Nocardioides terrae]SFC84440.1 hypothetical protein SAMN04487968_11289 [Nocardioides terrae]
MRNRLIVRSGSAAAAASLALLATGPALAADPVAQASATALRLGVAGQGADTGTFSATNDGTTQTTSGTHAPALPALAGQQATNLGTLAQDATTGARDGRGTSAACAGVAGEGATLVQVGDGTSCLSGGQTISLDVANADFSSLQVLPAEYTQGLDTATAQAVAPVVSQALQPLLAALDDPAIGLDLGAVQATCTASAPGAQGSASIAKAQAYVEGPQPIGRIVLADLPVDPAPNTHVVADLSTVAEAIRTGVDTDLANSLGGSNGRLAAVLGPLGATVDTVLDQIRTNVTDSLGPQLAPLQDNVLDIVLNKQSRPSADAIEVTALDASVLPAARQFVGADLAHLTIGHVACGPNGTVAPDRAVVTPAVDTPSTPEPDTAVPTAVKSGAGSLEHGPTPLAFGALGGLVLAGTGLAVWGFRRSLGA